MSTGSDSTNTPAEDSPPHVYVRRRDRMADQLKGLSRKDRRRVLDISQTYWAVEQDENYSESERARRLSLLKQHGDFSMAYSTAVQPLLEYHELNTVGGYIAFRKRWGTAFALADPVVAEENREELIRSFCEEHKNVTFCQVSEATAKVLDSLGLYVNGMGVDTTLELSDYDFKGKEKEWLRYADNWTKRRGYSVRECKFDEIEPSLIESVSEAWRDTRTVKRKEVRFLNRPIVVAKPEHDVRKFYFFDPDERLLAFVFLDPLYRDGEIVGYVTAFKRRHPDAPQYAEQALMKVIIETLQSEGVQQLKLGLSPVAWLETEAFRHNWVTAKLFRWGYQSKLVNRYCYNLTGHANYKRRFRGSEEKTYFASNTRFNGPRLLSLIGLCGIA